MDRRDTEIWLGDKDEKKCFICKKLLKQHTDAELDVCADKMIDIENEAELMSEK